MRVAALDRVSVTSSCSYWTHVVTQPSSRPLATSMAPRNVLECVDIVIWAGDVSHIRSTRLYAIVMEEFRS